MVNTGSIPVVTSKIITMQYILTCPNGKQIDMSSDILQQLERKIERQEVLELSLIHISEPTRQAEISYAVFCLKKKK